jgi:hypothetical protein
VTDPARPRPVPGPPRPGPVPGPVPARPPVTGDPDLAGPTGAGVPATADGSPFAGLAERPVAEHVAVYEAEHDRLQRELSTIDQL